MGEVRIDGRLMGQEADAAAIQAIYAPIVAQTPISFETEPPSVQEMAVRIRATLPAYPYLVAKLDGLVAGYAYASAHRSRAAYRWSVDVSAYVAPAARRAGIGRALYAELQAILERQGFHAAFAGIALPNEASVRLHEAAAFTASAVAGDGSAARAAGFAATNVSTTSVAQVIRAISSPPGSVVPPARPRPRRFPTSACP